MKFLDRWLSRARNSIGSSRELMEHLLREDAGAGLAMPVTPETSMRLGAVYACVRVLSEDMAKLPCHVYERIDRGKKRADGHWLEKLLQQPNEWQTGFEFREMQQAHIELSGNFYGLKTVVRDEVREILPLPPTRVRAEFDWQRWKPKYTVTWPDGSTRIIPSELMYHVRGLTLDGFLGVSPIKYQREVIASGLGMLRFGQRVFKNGAMLGGVLSHPTELSAPAFERLKSSFQEDYGGVDNAWKTILLEEGTTFTATGMNVKDAMWIESRKMNRTEIAAIYRVPPHLIGDLERATFSNIEQQSRDYVQNGLLGRARRLEERMRFSLLPSAAREQFFIEHLLDVLLRGDYKSRNEGYRAAILTGYLTRNEVRELENFNPGPPELDVFLAPLNMTSSKTLPDPNKDEQIPSDPSEPNPDLNVDPSTQNRRQLHAI